jgi:hypothetical protein
LQYTSFLPRDYKGVDEHGAEGVDEEVHPVEDMVMKIPVAGGGGGAWRGGGCPWGQRTLSPCSFFLKIDCEAKAPQLFCYLYKQQKKHTKKGG